MDRMNNANDIYLALVNLKDVLLGFAGGAIAYFLKYKREKEQGNEVVFDVGILIINIIMGGFVSYIVGSGLGPNVPYRDFIIGGLGVTAYNFLTLLESNFAGMIYNKLTINEKARKQEDKKETDNKPD